MTQALDADESAGVRLVAVPRGVGGGPVRSANLPLHVIDPNPRQPRTVFDDESIAELAASLRDIGLLQPVVVRPAGDRRLRAARLAGLDPIPALIRETDDSALLRDALLENIQRVNLNPLEEASAYQQLIDDFACTHEDVAGAVGKSRSHVSHMLALLRLPTSVARRVAAGVLTAGHAKALSGLLDPSVCGALADRIVAEGLSVRATEELIALGDLPGWEGEPAKRPRRRTRPAPPPDVAALASELEDRLDTHVRIEAGKTKGRVIIEFGGHDDLARIAQALRAQN